jgi:peroxiredoxin
MKAPNIILPDTAGKVVDLSEIKAERTLVLFYASWCPHCRKNLPILVRLYNAQKKKKIEVVAVSIDTVKTEWINTIKKYKMNFTNLSDLKGWEGKASRDYFIYATPTMFLLDRNMYVVSKPQTIDEVKKIFRNIALGP